jgi:hypothetical protein
MPAGDPAELRAVGAQFGRLAADHAAQLTSFHGAVKTALAGWQGPMAEQYAVAAGQTCGRFTGVCVTLKEAQLALNAYATALEEAQQQIGGLNAQYAALPAPKEGGRGAVAEDDEIAAGKASLQQENDSVTGTLQAAQRVCAMSLDRAESALALACPDTLTPQQMLDRVRQIMAHLSSPGAVAMLDQFLGAFGLVNMAAKGTKGQQAANTLAEETASLLSKEDYTEAEMRALMRMGADEPMLENWVRYTAFSMLNPEVKSKAAAAVEVAESGDGFWAGLVKSAQIDVADAGAHAAAPVGAWDTFTDVAARASKFDAALAVLNLAVSGDEIWAGLHENGWKGTGDLADGVVGAAGGLGQFALLSDAAGLTAITSVIPGLDVITATCLLGAAAWTIGEVGYEEIHAHWHAIAHAFDTARHDMAEAADDVGHWLDAPAHGIDVPAYPDAYRR